ncbi:uncharacterized protein LOC111693127 [Anoplophora glabripennis]|uniref:uncharacterized protein LOC111693127 n=1 Tax=Anoplophora glabripennis TaxID=217634 RepID=UPI000C79100F|nr:uncharacterized protein LOC111693127 [Anoplophora glabripennis]
MANKVVAMSRGPKIANVSKNPPKGDAEWYDRHISEENSPFDNNFEKGLGDLHGRTILYTSKSKKYLINTSTCKIPDIDPFNDEIKKYVRKEKYTKCTNLGLLTYTEKEDGLVLLKINTSVMSQYSFFEINCCYSEIYRFNYENKSDNEVRYSSCTQFKDKTVISYPFIRVKCSNWFRYVYSNVHATVLATRHEVAHKINRTNHFSVLVIGIDSISKLNLRRTMPKTYAYLEQHFHGLKGYNKIGDNTFPNLMAILTGQSTSQLSKSCNTGKLNVCDFIWNTFRESGYVTAYAEDEGAINTFNYDRRGFRDPPTDFYYRPYFVASEELGRKLRYGMTYCAGPETSAERMLNAARDFSVSFKDVPTFGLFWMNSFSHENINMPSAMDERVLEFLSDSIFKSSLENTVMVFLSDHGFRFGDIRLTRTGWLEERLPFIYVYIADSFKKKFREKYENFMVNTERLTTPFDIYCTFQDILEISNCSYKAKKSRACPNCQSLFTTIRENRTCREAAIDLHWCSCIGHNQVSSKNELLRKVALFVVKEINKVVRSFVEGSGCSTYALKDIVTGGMSVHYLNENSQTVRQIVVVAETSPKAIFEATVEAYTISEENNFKLLGDISRLNRYKSNSYCVEDPILKKYCFCNRTAF